jgi:hypothetical protein
MACPVVTATAQRVMGPCLTPRDVFPAVGSGLGVSGAFPDFSLRLPEKSREEPRADTLSQTGEQYIARHDCVPSFREPELRSAAPANDSRSLDVVTQGHCRQWPMAVDCHCSSPDQRMSGARYAADSAAQVLIVGRRPSWAVERSATQPQPGVSGAEHVGGHDDPEFVCIPTLLTV